MELIKCQSQLKIMFLLCFVLLWFLYLPISFRVISLALGQSWDCPNASEVTLKDVGKKLTDSDSKAPIFSIYSSPLYIFSYHYSDVMRSMMVSQITSLMIVYSTVYSGADQRKHQNSASLAFVWWIPCTKGQLCRKCFHLMNSSCWTRYCMVYFQRYW